jgi:hypothetical protein
MREQLYRKLYSDSCYLDMSSGKTRSLQSRVMKMG